MATDEHPPLPSYGSLVQVPSGTLPTPQLSKRIVLNVGGVRHEVIWKTLDRLPHTRLGKLRYCTTHEALMELCDDYNFKEMEFFFNRQSRSFSSILNFYQTGKLHLAEDVCILSFKEDLEYWNIDEQYLESCCQHKYHDRKDHVLEEVRKDAKLAVEDFGTGNCVKWRQKLWNLLEKPHASKAALLLTILSVVAIIVCVVSMMLNTLPQLMDFSLVHPVPSLGDPVPSLVDIDEDGYTTDNKILTIIEASCVVWLTLEWILRFWASPSKLVFIKDVVNIIDLLANIAYYISLMLPTSIYITRWFNDLLGVFQVFRLLRLVKLTRYSMALKSLGHTLKRSWRALGLLVMFLVIEVIVFSTLVYFVEKDIYHGQFSSIPDAFWWAVVTMTTVGYGDRIPVTAWGKLVGTACGISGILFIVLPIPTLVYNFRECYGEQVRREKALKRREALNPTKGRGDIVSLSVVNAQDVNSGGTGSVGGGKDPATDLIASSPLLQETCRNEDEDQIRLQSIKAVSSN